MKENPIVPVTIPTAPSSAAANYESENYYNESGNRLCLKIPFNIHLQVFILFIKNLKSTKNHDIFIEHRCKYHGF
ncbi:hypothetical protein [Oceanobacillus sojae]|uniref:hypothetical protein n=1 Tax=Oceanobacillus sojae TaxID=582851 RepID=UPI00363A76C0